jgi:fumarylacetoacetase
MINETHDPVMLSWVSSANASDSDFPIQNLPFAVFRCKGKAEPFRCGVAIGDQILDLAAASRVKVFQGAAAKAADAGSNDSLNELMAMGISYWSDLRLALSRALRINASEQHALTACLVPQREAEYDLPARIGDYTDFYTSIHHATNIGRQFRPDNPLLPNFKWIPIGYHGRCSSIGVSGQRFPRPVGQLKSPDMETPVLAACKRMDIELELGIFIGQGNDSGVPIPIGQAEQHVFGLCLLNDWSARDIQAWEYQPLGPFLAKNFATTLSPWVVTLEALEPYRLPFTRAESDPQPLAYLDSPSNRQQGCFDIRIEALIRTERMLLNGTPAFSLARTSYKYSYWTIAQLVTHHTVNGCNLRPGDLFGSGTMSGPTLEEAAALIELTVGGMNPIALPGGESRTWLEDGDTTILTGWCEGPGKARIGFGSCEGTVLPARSSA